MTHVRRLNEQFGVVSRRPEQVFSGMDDKPPATAAEAEEIQERLREQLDLESDLLGCPADVAGLDVSYEEGTRRLVAAAVVIGYPDLEVREIAIAEGKVSFPYLPGLLGFREAPMLMQALSKLARSPEVLVCDGYGLMRLSESPQRCSAKFPTWAVR